MEIDVLYPLRYDSGSLKDQALNRMFGSIRSMMNQKGKHTVNICISDCSSSSTLSFFNDNFKENKFKYIHKPYPGLFNPSLTRNFGVKNLVTSEIFFLSDIDLLYPEFYIEEMMDLMVPGVVRITPRMKGLNQDGSFAMGDAPGNGSVDLKVFHQVRGFSEEFLGYGPEDVDLNYRMGFYGQYIKEKPIQNTPIHQWHGRISPRNMTRQNDAIWADRSKKLFSGNYVEVNVGKTWGEIP